MTPLVVANDQGIVARLEEFITDYGAIPKPHYALAIALWALATHCFHKFDVFGYLCFMSLTPGAGKTRMLEILECFCCRAQLKVKITLAGMCSIIEECQPTILVDQAERLSRNDHNELMACILAGYRQGLSVTIQRKGESMDRPIYCPKAFALLGEMLEAARDRSIVIEMRPARTRRRWYRPEAKERGEALQKRCTQLVVESGDAIDDAFANFDGLPFLLEREEEIWTPLFVMCEVFCRSRRTELERAAADICAAKRAEPKRVSARAAKQQADALRDGERLLRDLIVICGTAVGVRTNEALRGLKEIHNAPWRNYAGEGITDIRLAELVRAFGVGPRQFKVDGKNLRGYLRSDLEEGLRAVGVPGEPATPLPARSEAARSGVAG